jgi:hypothetical protein
LRWRDPAAIAAAPPGADRRRSPYDHEALRLLAHVDQAVIPRLERLRWLDLDVEEQGLLELRQRIRGAAREPFSPGVAAAARGIADDVAEIQHRTLERLIEQIYADSWNFGGSAFTAMQQVGREDVVCPNCLRPRAARILMRHRVERQLWFQTVQCRRCGDVWWTTEQGERTIALDGPVDVEGRRGGPVVLERSVSNRSGADRRGSVGYALRSRKRHGLPPGTVERLLVPGGGSRVFRATVDLTDCRPRADTHTTPFVALFDGVYLASMAMLALA